MGSTWDLEVQFIELKKRLALAESGIGARDEELHRTKAECHELQKRVEQCCKETMAKATELEKAEATLSTAWAAEGLRSAEATAAATRAKEELQTAEEIQEKL